MQFFIFICTFGFIAAVYSQPLNVSVKAKSAVLYNPKNGAVLFQKRAKEPHYPASILKIATALFVLEQKNISLETCFSVTSDALETVRADLKHSDFLSYPPYILEHDGTMMGLEKGKAYSILSLLHGLMLVSGNDAANVLAKGISGSISKFMDDLNQYLCSKGAHQTRFQNPHGLHHPAQMTTAYDMAVIGGLAFQNPLFCQVAKCAKYKLENGKVIVNTNRLLKEGKYSYPKYIGGKTGYIASAGYNLVAAAEHEERLLVAVILGCKKSEDRFEDAINLFEAAFAEKPKQRILFSKNHESFLRKESEKLILKARLDQDITLDYFPSEEPDLQAKLVWHKIKFPIFKNAIVGKLVVENESGIELASAPLFAEEDLRGSSKNYKSLWLFAPLGGLLFFQLNKKRRKFLKR